MAGRVAKKGELTMSAISMKLLGEALNKVGGPLNDFLQKRHLDPEKWDTAFARFVREQNPWSEESLKPAK